MRTPQDIAADAQALVDKAAADCVPVSSPDLRQLVVEFMNSVAAQLAQQPTVQ